MWHKRNKTLHCILREHNQSWHANSNFADYFSNNCIAQSVLFHKNWKCFHLKLKVLKGLLVQVLNWEIVYYEWHLWWNSEWMWLWILWLDVLCAADGLDTVCHYKALQTPPQTPPNPPKLMCTILLCQSPGSFWRSPGRTCPSRAWAGVVRSQTEGWTWVPYRYTPFHLHLQRSPKHDRFIRGLRRPGDMRVRAVTQQGIHKDDLV